MRAVSISPNLAQSGLCVDERAGLTNGCGDRLDSWLRLLDSLQSMPGWPKLHLKIASRFEELELVDGTMEAMFRHLRLSEEEIANTVLAVREAAANAILHGNCLDAEKAVEIRAEVNSGGLTIQVRDRGSGFDVEKLADPLAPANLLKSSGRGIFLMRNFMDEVTFEFPESAGTLVLMSKQISAANQDLPEV
jgi:serine/threonine-protein kinase RsbW